MRLQIERLLMNHPVRTCTNSTIRLVREASQTEELERTTVQQSDYSALVHAARSLHGIKVNFVTHLGEV